MYFGLGPIASRVGYGGNKQCQGLAFLLVTFSKQSTSLQQPLSQMPTLCGHMKILMMKKEEEEKRMLKEGNLTRAISEGFPR